MGAPKASDSYASDASNSSLDLDSSMGDVHSITAPPEASFFQICREFDHLMATTEKRLPPQWSLPEFSRSVIGEEGVQDPTYLTNVCSDLSQHALQSWYWEEASQFLTLITSSGIELPAWDSILVKTAAFLLEILNLIFESWNSLPELRN